MKITLGKRTVKNILLTLGAGLVASLAAITAHAQNLYVSVGPDEAIFEYTPTPPVTQSTYASGLGGHPRGLAFDSSGNLFVALILQQGQTGSHFLGRVLKFNPNNKLNGVGSAGNSLFEGLATDSAGNVYVIGLDAAQNGPFVSTVHKFTPSGQESVFGSVPGQGYGLAFDSAGNLYAAENDFAGDSNDQTIFKFAPDGTRTVFVGPSYFASGQYPVGLAFDSMGNLFVSTESFNGTPTDEILKFTPAKVESIIAMGLTMPRGIAFDGSGNLFVAEDRPAPDGDILEFLGGGGPATVFASGLGGPQFLTFGPPR